MYRLQDRGMHSVMQHVLQLTVQRIAVFNHILCTTLTEIARCMSVCVQGGKEETAVPLFTV